MESVNIDGKLANPTKVSAQFAPVNLCRQLSWHACRWPTPQGLRDHISFTVEGVVRQLSFFARRTAASGEVREQALRCVFLGEANLEFEVEDRTLLQTVYGDTYLSVSAVDGREVPLSLLDIQT